MLSGRTTGNINDYFFLCHYFVRRVVGCTRYDQHIAHGGRYSEIATSSDEAFTLAVLVNNYDKWLHTLLKLPPKETPAPRFTNSKGRKAEKNNGWSPEGMAYAGDLHDEYEKLRSTEYEARVKELDGLYTKYWSARTGRTTASNQKGTNPVDAREAALAKYSERAFFPEKRKPLQMSGGCNKHNAKKQRK